VAKVLTIPRRPTKVKPASAGGGPEGHPLERV